MYLNPWRAFIEMEGKLKILSVSKLTTIISFTCKSNIWYGVYSQIGSSQTLDKHTLKRMLRQSNSNAPFLWNQTIPQKMHHVFWVQRRNTVAQWNDTASFSCNPSNFSWTFCLWTKLCASTNSLIFSALAVQITIPKYKELPGQFYPLLQWAKHINKTYKYFNLLLMIPLQIKK